MANYATLKAAISAAIKQNGNNEITGNLLQQQLLAMVNSLGVGYQYIGIATPATNPGTPDQNVFYLASTAGTYANFGGAVLADGEIAILKYNGAWSKDSTGGATKNVVDSLEQLSFPYFIGDNSVFANSGQNGIPVKAGRTYRVYLFTKTWDITNVGTTGNVLGLGFLRKDTDQAIYVENVQISDFENINDYYDITIPNEEVDGNLLLRVGGRADEGEKVQFAVQDVTDIVLLNSAVSLEKITHSFIQSEMSVGSLFEGAPITSYTALYEAEFIEVLSGSNVEIPAAQNLRYRVCEYDGEKGFIRESSFINTTVRRLGQNTKYIRIAIAYTDRGYSQDNPVSVSDFVQGDLVLVFYASKTQQQINKLIKDYPIEYYGDLVDVSTHKLDFSQFMSVPDSYSGHVIQASAVYGNTLFQLYDAGYCRTYDLLTKTLLNEFATAAQISTNHCGGACFGDKFFADNANYPALYVSGDLTNFCCYVLSVSESGSVLKQKLDFSNLSTYKKASGSQVVIDTLRKKVIYQQRVNSSISDLSNDFFICEFALPELTDGVLDGNNVLVVDMNDNMVEKSYVLPYYPGIYQAAIIINGQLLQTHGLQLNSYGMQCSVVSYDAISEPHNIKSIINLDKIYIQEPEGIFVYNDELYITYVDGKVFKISL